MGGMGDSYVVSTARLKCTMGSAPSTLTVLPVRTVFMAGQPMSNISDHKSIVNIAPFGLCRSLANPVVAAATAANLGRLQPMPCIPNTQTPWFPGKPDTLIKGQPALLKTCKCACMWAGIISITDDGQHGVGCIDVVNQLRLSNSPTPFVHKELPKMTELSQDTLSSSYKMMRNSQNSRDTTLKAGTIGNLINKAFLPHEKGKGYIGNFMQPFHGIAFKMSRNNEQYMDDRHADLLHSNIHYSLQDAIQHKLNNIDYKYGINCPITTITFMLRKQGYNVTAKAVDANEHTKTLGERLNYYSAWKNSDGSAVKPTMLQQAFNLSAENKGFKSKMEELKALRDELGEIPNDKIQLQRIQYYLEYSNLSSNDNQTIKAELIRIIEQHSLSDNDMLQIEEAQQVMNNPQLCEDLIQKLMTRETEIRSSDNYTNLRKDATLIFKDVLMESCNEDGYYTLGLSWEAGGGHYTVIKRETDSEGNVIFTNIEPQTGDAYPDIDSLLENLVYPPDDYDTVMRTDDKEFNEEYSDIVDIYFADGIS